MKIITEKVINKLKKNNFKFDENVTSKMVFLLLLKYLSSILRTQKYFYKKNIDSIVFLGKRVKITNRVKINRGTTIGDYTRINGLGRRGVEIGSSCNIAAFCSLICSVNYNKIGEAIIIGNNVAIGEYSYIGGASKVTIGDDTIIGQYLSIHPQNHNYENKDKLIRLQGTNEKGVEIGQNCWLGSKVTFLDGSKIGDGCIVAAGSLVTKSFGDNVILGGVPAKIIKYI
jgi:acetyltransferase-like isoleucine patch superfamily enzyme